MVQFLEYKSTILFLGKSTMLMQKKATKKQH